MSQTYHPTTENANHDLARRVSLFLASQQRQFLRRLQVVASDGIVTVQGTVASFYEKQLAQQAAIRVAGVRQYIDQVVVAVDSPRQHHLVFALAEAVATAPVAVPA